MPLGLWELQGDASVQCTCRPGGLLGNCLGFTCEASHSCGNMLLPTYFLMLLDRLLIRISSSSPVDPGIVLLPLGRVAQHLVGFRDALEALGCLRLGSSVSIAVWVVLQGQAPESRLHLLGSGARLHPQPAVVTQRVTSSGTWCRPAATVAATWSLLVLLLLLLSACASILLLLLLLALLLACKLAFKPAEGVPQHLLEVFCTEAAEALLAATVGLLLLLALIGTLGLESMHKVPVPHCTQGRRQGGHVEEGPGPGQRESLHSPRCHQQLMLHLPALHSANTALCCCALHP